MALKHILPILAGLFLVVLILPIVSGSQMSIIATNPAQTIAGEYADITIQVRGAPVLGANSISNVSIYIQENDFIKPVPNQVLLVNELFENQVVTRTFRVFLSSSIPSGEIPLSVVKEFGSTKIIYQDSLLVTGGRNPPVITLGQIRSTPDRLLSDTKDNRIFVTLQNVGDTTAELLTARISSPYIQETHLNSLTTIVSRLGSLEQDVLEFDFDIEKVTESKRSIPITIEVTYSKRDAITSTLETITESLTANLSLSRAPYFDVSIQEIRPLQIGSRNQEILVSITNLNQREGENVRLRLFPDPSSPFDFERTTYFVSPRIEQNNTHTVLITFDVLSSALTQDYVILAEVESLLGQNRFVQVTPLTISISVNEQSTIRERAGVLIALLILVAITIGYFSRKKKR